MIARVVEVPSECSLKVLCPRPLILYLKPPLPSQMRPSSCSSLSELVTHPLAHVVTQFSRRAWRVINSLGVGQEANRCTRTEHAFPAFGAISWDRVPAVTLTADKLPIPLLSRVCTLPLSLASFCLSPCPHGPCLWKAVLPSLLLGHFLFLEQLHQPSE